ncbi:MAG: bifunctional heptose 7-phosphate kinase/heptose 1-phosphate adenyltransferase [Deltaproteobacteria bacterium]|nr:bifunctional heptose 7-phosphate kinase/heptose 1-phosphate adenyltransferase [Deltaproteobacteria bacterium]
MAGAMNNLCIELPVAKPPRLLVVGEVVLDRYLWGTVERVSPEAPIPVLHLTRSEERLGNAAFVAASVRALGGEAHLLSVVGADLDGRKIGRIATELGIGCDSLIEVVDRPTIVKERLLGAAQSAQRGIQQMLRVDREDATPLDRTTEEMLLARLGGELDAADGVLVCDIDKGMLTPRLLSEMIRIARSQRKPIVVDPRRASDFSLYRGASVLTPNRFEAQYATGLDMSDAENWPKVASKLIADLGLSVSLVTLDRDGMFLSERSGPAIHIETTPREVYDVTGAGDIVLATFGFFWIAGVPVPEAAALANAAGGLEVARHGATVISLEELAAALHIQPGSSRKIRNLHELSGEVDRHRRAGRKICFLDAKFGALDVGRVELLECARALGDLLIVGFRGAPGSQQIDQVARSEPPEQARILAALEAVDYVLMVESPSLIEIVHCIRPDIFVASECLSGSNGDEFEAVRSYGGRVVPGDVRAGQVSSWPPKTNGSLKSGASAVQESFSSSVLLPRV